MTERITVQRSETFIRWLVGLRDKQAAARIQVRIDRLEAGNPGDIKPVGGGISEMRINFGPGYRVYLQQRADVLVILLCGGDKSTQDKDIKQARKIAEEWSQDG